LKSGLIIHKADAVLQWKQRISVWIWADTRYSSSRPHKTDILMGTSRWDVTGKGSTAAIIILGTWISCLWCVIYGILKLIGQLWLPDSQLEIIRLRFARI